MRALFSALIKISPIRWQRVLEDSRLMRSLLNKVILIATDGLTKELCIGAYLFTRTVMRLGRKSGWLHLALYLKQCSSSLQTAYGGVKLPPTLLPVPVSLTWSGYPRIIPSFHRRMMYRKDDRADMLVKIYLSFFSLAKIIELAKKVTKKTFKSIVSPWDDPDSVVLQVMDMRETFVYLLKRYTPWLPTIPLHQGMTWDPPRKEKKIDYDLHPYHRIDTEEKAVPVILQRKNIESQKWESYKKVLAQVEDMANPAELGTYRIQLALCGEEESWAT